MERQILQELRQLDEQFGTEAAQLPIEISTRFTRTLGQYRVDYRQKQRSFRFHARLGENHAFLRQVVRHEFIHYYLESQHGIIGHGKAFRQLCRVLEIPPRATLIVPAEFAQQTPRYQLVCQNCQQVVGTRSRLTQALKQRLRRSVCRDCQGKIMVVDQFESGHNQGIRK